MNHKVTKRDWAILLWSTRVWGTKFLPENPVRHLSYTGLLDNYGTRQDASTGGRPCGG